MLTIYDLCVGKWFVSSSAVDTGMKVSIICTQVSHQFSPDNVCLITDDPVLLECVTHLPSHVTRYVTPVPGTWECNNTWPNTSSGRAHSEYGN